MSWIYADLSKNAKNNGGPKEYERKLIGLGKRIGRRQMVPYLFLCFLGGGGIVKLIDWIIQTNRKRKMVENGPTQSIQKENAIDTPKGDTEMTREELKAKIDELMRQYSEEEIDGSTYAQKMMELTTSARDEVDDDE